MMKSQLFWVVVVLLLSSSASSNSYAGTVQPETRERIEARGQTDDAVSQPAGEASSDANTLAPQQSGSADEATIRQMIADLNSLNAQERAQALPRLLTAIEQLPSAYTKGYLSQELTQKLAQLTAQGQDVVAAEELPEESPQAKQERESFEATMKQAQTPLPSEEDIRKQIDELAKLYDPKQPEIALNQAWELAGIIDRIEDHELQTTLRKILTDRVAVLQADSQTAPLQAPR